MTSRRRTPPIRLPALLDEVDKCDDDDDDADKEKGKENGDGDGEASIIIVVDMVLGGGSVIIPRPSLAMLLLSIVLSANQQSTPRRPQQPFRIFLISQG